MEYWMKEEEQKKKNDKRFVSFVAFHSFSVFSLYFFHRIKLESKYPHTHLLRMINEIEKKMQFGRSCQVQKLVLLTLFLRFVSFHLYFFVLHSFLAVIWHRNWLWIEINVSVYWMPIVIIAENYTGSNDRLM